MEGCEARSDKEEVGTKPVGQDVKEPNYGVSCVRSKLKSGPRQNKDKLRQYPEPLDHTSKQKYVSSQQYRLVSFVEHVCGHHMCTLIITCAQHHHVEKRYVIDHHMCTAPSCG